jgi:hypothetical protein
MARLPAQAAVARMAVVVAAAMTMVACAITPRTAPPSLTWKTRDGLQQVLDCVLAQLNTKMSKEPEPRFTHSVSIVTPGKVEEIIPQQIPPSRGELYVVRFTADDSGTQVQLFSTLEGLDKRVEQALAPCKEKAHPVATTTGQ